MQHHDAVTGTEKQHVAADYERILDQAVNDVLVIPRRAFRAPDMGQSSRRGRASRYERDRAPEVVVRVDMEKDMVDGTNIERDSALDI
ncbi:hypothetical protein EVAR_86892_1 [Eumeta japonica]|uniref:Glycoside hydrolase family 38 central domain-containing protein n=1 Tax=Eumeta variegata TaxID=151549 RepID=A0A4C1ZK58_EUMVA|nr:hypothetical protein EVAR_86892_1 [Eumeta japonica]